MKTIELFAGTQSFSKVLRQYGAQTFTVDIENRHKPDLEADIATLSARDFPYRPEILWCSPPCEGFSVAAVGHHWCVGGEPKSHTAIKALQLVRHTLRLVAELKPDWFFIENPRGMLRKQKILKNTPRHTITYCQYGDIRMKPTDIWTNAHWWSPRTPCKNGSPCHEAAPRGSRSGTQGLKGATARGAIPALLFEEILSQYPQEIQVAA